LAVTVAGAVALSVQIDCRVPIPRIIPLVVVVNPQIKA
jgi:hypothetical protein